MNHCASAGQPALFFGGLALLASSISGCSSGEAPGEFRDCEVCPNMVTVAAGSFAMGTAEADRLPDPRTGKPATNDSPQHTVTFAEPFSMGKYEVTVEEFGRFIEETGFEQSGGCMEFRADLKFTINPDMGWDDPGFEQSSDAPVVCISFFDAQAYVDWLREKTGRAYRLPTEAEWEYATRAGSTTSYFWGNDAEAACGFANVRTPGAVPISQRQADSDAEEGFPCDDSRRDSSAVGSFQPNAFGLYDTLGNAWEWVSDCNHPSYEGAPADGSAWIDDPECKFGVIRGGSFLNRVERSSSSVRAGRPRTGRAPNMGFRVARGAEIAATPAGEDISWTAAAASAAGAEASVGEKLFNENCTACHVDKTTFTGVYGTDQTTLENVIRSGGNNVMSMPEFGSRLSEPEIVELAAHVRSMMGWN